MIKTLFFGNGPIAQRMKFERMFWHLEFKLQDMWVGAFWKTQGHCLDIWLCVIPCIPIHITVLYHDPEQ